MVPNDPNPNKEPSPQSRAIRSARRRAEALNNPGASAPAKPLVAGDVIGGRFRLDRQVGEGGMGVVWLAWDKTLDEAVALKFLPGQVARDPIAVEELRKEAKTMRGLTHPGIVRLHDIRFADGRAFLVQAFMAGGSLGDFLASIPEGNLSLEETMWVLREIAPALSHAHSEGITHRDIKPANLLLSKNPGDYLGGGGESLRVADFGLAFTAREAASRTSGYRPSGTLAFMAPEILMGKRPTPAADVYSLAATAYCLLTGRPPFDKGDIATQAVHAEAPRVNSGRPSLDGAIRAGLEKNPEDRPETVEQFMACVEGSARPPRTAANSKRLNLAVGIGLVAGILVIGGYFTRDQWMGDPPEVLADRGDEEERAESGTPSATIEKREKQAEESLDESSPTAPENSDSSSEPVQATPPPATPSSAKPAAETTASKLATHIALIDGAGSLSEVEDALKGALEAGLRRECEALCAAMTPRLESILDKPVVDFNAGLARLTELEALHGRTDCEVDETWLKLGVLALSADGVAASVAGSEFADVLTVRNAAVLHGGDGHVCLAGEELVTISESSTRELETRLVKAGTPGNFRFLELLPILEASEVDFPRDILTAAYVNMKAIGAGETVEQDLAAIRALGVYIDDREDAPAEVFEAIDRVVGSALDRSIEVALEESKNDRVARLFEQLFEIEESLGSAGDPELGDLRPFAERVESEFATDPNIRDLVRHSYVFLGEHPSSALEPGILLMLDNAIAGLVAMVPKNKKAGYDQRYFENVFEVAQTANGLESGLEFLELGEEGRPTSAVQRVREVVVPRIDRVIEKWKGKVDDGDYAIAAKDLRALERALAKFSALREEYIDVLPKSAKAQMDYAMHSTHDFRTNEKMKTKVTSRRSLEDAAKSGEAWLQVALEGVRDRKYLSEAYDLVIKSYFYQAEVNYLFARRVYKPKTPKQGKYVNPPKQKEIALEKLAIARDYFTRFSRADSSAAIASGWSQAMSDMEHGLSLLRKQN